MTCAACGSDHLVPLGRMGSLLWLRCRACGIDQSVPAEEWEEDETP